MDCRPRHCRKLSSAIGVLLTVCQFAMAQERELQTVSVTANTPDYTSLTSDQLQFELSNISSSISLVVFQVHSWKNNVTLSSYIEVYIGSAVSGRDIGVVAHLQKNQTSCSWYLSRNDTHDADAVKILFVASTYGYSDPIPGGCNTELQPEDSPAVQVHFDVANNHMTFAYGNIGGRRGEKLPDCSDKTCQERLQYDLYMYHMSAFDHTEDGYFNAMREMMFLNSSVEISQRVGRFNWPESATTARFNALSGRGVLYGVVVTQKNRQGGPSYATYVPAVTYSCGDASTDCYGAGGAFGATLAVILALIGLALCFLGHRYFKTEMFIFGFFAFLLVGFIIMARLSPLAITVCVVISLFLGVAGGVLWWTFWYFKGIPVVSVLVVGMVAGFLVASFAFNVTPLGNLALWESSFNYGMAFTCAILILPVCLLACTKMLNLISCALVGSYLLVFALDIFLRGSVKEILLVSLHRAAYDDMRHATIVLPWTAADIVLLVVWGLLFLAGLLFQYMRERHKSPFPPCPWLQKQMRASLRVGPPPGHMHVAQSNQIVNGNSGALADDEGSEDEDFEDAEENDEEAPLIQAQRQLQKQYEHYRQQQEREERQKEEEPQYDGT